MGEPKLVKVCLTNRGDDTETPWAQDLGPAPGAKGSRRVKLVNVPFMHAKPTWGDTIVVSPVEDGLPTWDRDGLPWAKITTRIADDGGRWAMIVDYATSADDEGEAAFKALTRACEAHSYVCEGAWGPSDGEPGRVYLAVGNDVTAHAVMSTLTAASLPCTLIQIHPEPKKPKAAAVKPAKKPAGVTKPPSGSKPATKAPKKAPVARASRTKPAAKTAKTGKRSR